MAKVTTRFNLNSEQFATAAALTAAVRSAQVGEISTINEYHELIERLRGFNAVGVEADIAAIEELIKDEQNHRGILQRIEQKYERLGIENYNAGLNGEE